MMFHALGRLCAFGRWRRFPRPSPPPAEPEIRAKRGGPFWKHKQVSDSYRLKVDGRTSTTDHFCGRFCSTGNSIHMLVH